MSATDLILNSFMKCQLCQCHSFVRDNVEPTEIRFANAKNPIIYEDRLIYSGKIKMIISPNTLKRKTIGGLKGLLGLS